MLNLVIVALLVLTLVQTAYANILLDKVVAVVGKDVITWSEVYAGMRQEFAETLKNLKEEDKFKIMREHEATYLENLIDRRLIIQEAEKLDIKVSESEIDATIKDIRAKHNLTNDKDFEAMLKLEGYTPRQYRKSLYEQILTNRVIDREIRNKIIVTEKDIEDYIASNKLTIDNSEGFAISQIFVKQTDEKAMQSKLTEIYARLRAGEPFTAVAEIMSDDPVSARHGGNLGFIKKSDLSKEFLAVLSNMKKGEISEPIKTPAGLIILRLDGVTAFANDTEFKNNIKAKIYDERFAKAMQRWLKELRQKAYIEVKL